MSDTFTPQSLTVSEVFTNSDPIYKIPDYQRPYSWVDDQVEKLWEDLYTSFENNKNDPKIDANYFLGSLIVVPNETSGEDVVDGQQRLTTLMILFNVIKQLFPEINKNINAEDNKNVIKIGKIKNCIHDSNETTRLRLNTRPSHQNDFNKSILNNNDLINIAKPSKKDIENDVNYKFINTAYIFKTKLQIIDVNEVGDFINYIFNKVKIIKITCTNSEFAIKLFQVLNSRGLDLTHADLIKSKLIYSLKDEKKASFISDWDSIAEISEDLDVNLTELFTIYQYYLLAKNPKKSLIDELETEFKGKDSNVIINDFKSFVKIYDKEIYQERSDKLIYSFWYLVWGFYWKTIILTALHTKYPEVDLLKFSLRRFYYLNWIAGKNLNLIKQTSFSLIEAVKAKKGMTEVDKIINVQLEKNNIINLALEALTGEVYFEKWIKPLLILVHYNQTDADEVTWVNTNKNLHLEHILPQTFYSQEAWSHFSKEDGNKIVHSLGNLTLLSGEKNIKASNSSFKDKIQIYQKNGVSSFEVTRKIIDDYNSNLYKKKWNEKSIKERHNWLINEIGVILAIDTSSIKQ